MRRILLAAVAVLFICVPFAIAYPPAILTSDEDSITVGGLDCGTTYEIRVRERRSGSWRDQLTYTKATAACATPTPTPTATATPSPTATPTASPTPTATATPTPTVTPTPEPEAFPNPATTGTPEGWVPAQTRSTDLTVTTDGALVQDVRFTNGASLDVRAKNVTVRRVNFQGGTITNQYGTAPAGCGSGLLVEDTTFEQIPGQFIPSDFPVLGEGGYTARRVEIDGRGEGFRASDCGPVTLEDNFVLIHGADPGTPSCDAVHSDGVQAYYGRGINATNNTLVWQTFCGTAAWWVPSGQGNEGTYNVDRLLVGGGGFTFRQMMPGSITGLRVIEDSWVYGPTDVTCSLISSWEAKRVTVDANYRITSEVADLPCG